MGTKSCPSVYVSQPAIGITTTAEGSSSEIPASGASGDSSFTTPTVATINPLYEAWVTTDQLLLGWLYNSMTSEVATQVMGYENAKDLWDAIQSLFGIQSRAEEDFLRQTFQQTRKGNSKMIDYLRLMKSHADSLGQAGNPVTQRNLVSQVLLGLDEEYNAIVAMVQGRGNVSWSELQAELLVFEKRLELQTAHKSAITFNQSALVNMASSRGQSLQANRTWNQNSGNSHRGQMSNNSNSRGGYNNFNGRGRGRGRGYENYGNNNNRPICQVCGKIGT
ncbi:MAG: hypothetical protein Q8836_02390 [Sweet potato little leaf phytoplasma]|nr:hypothetical protein [Sweet potato little leaf phytoplasma]